ncbi:hypothetical protein A5782_16510 [Mycobacterium sp. 852002-40037_SCH5390672]|nr:hypothetical protein A5782_16510 [Mycobacterium sp. 852002-40037_SCH5390672]
MARNVFQCIEYTPLSLVRGGHFGQPGVICEHEPAPPHYRRPRHLLEALEAGRPVVVPNTVLHGHSLRHFSVPWKPTQVRYVRVWPDDVVTPAGIPRGDRVRRREPH